MQPGEFLTLRPGAAASLIARNPGGAPVRVTLELSGCEGLTLEGNAARRVLPGQDQHFRLRHVVGQEMCGTILARSEDAPRPNWWDRRGWRESALRPALALRVRDEHWVTGSPTVVFPPGVRRQWVHFFNDAERPRPFESAAPEGFLLTGGRGEVAPNDSLRLLLTADTGAGEAGSWKAGPEENRIPWTRMQHRVEAPGPDAVIAIDFGTRNTGIRIRWRRGLVSGKPAGTVDVIGDRAGNARFPTQMVLHLQDKSFRWGSEAAEHVSAQRLTADEVAVDNLKTDLREGVERYAAVRPDWTNAALLCRYFRQIFGRVDEYLRCIGDGAPLGRDTLRLRYTLCRPVLDANDGDEVGRRYEETLLAAMEQLGVRRGDVSMVHEPIAAAIGIARRRETELAALQPGTPVAVVDSGGGTTHVALARVDLEGGQLSLQPAGSYALHLGPENPAIEALEAFKRHGIEDRREVGGNVLDAALAFSLGVEAPKLLESHGRPIPLNLWRGSDRGGSAAPPRARVREILGIARRLKERFAVASSQYLNRSPGEPSQPGEILPFPHREDLQGVYLVHALYEEHLLEPILSPVVAELGTRTVRERPAGGLGLEEIRHVFFVGGTAIDPFVRRHFLRAFPSTGPEKDPEAQTAARFDERLNAVVEGAVWCDERLFPSAPFDLELRIQDEVHPVLRAGQPLLPISATPPRFFTQTLLPGQELDARLRAPVLGAEVDVDLCRGFYRNGSGDPEEVTLRLHCSREEGVTASLQSIGGTRPQWRLLLCPENE